MAKIETFLGGAFLPAAARHGAEALAMLRVCQGRSPMCLAVERSLRETEHELAVSGAASSSREEEEDAPFAREESS